MIARRIRVATVLVLALGWLGTAAAQYEDVTFFVIGKHAKFEQQADGSLAPVDFSFFSEIFFTPDGDASDAFLNLPTGERLRYRDQRLAEGPAQDNLLLITGAKRFRSYSELQSWYPDGEYEIEFDTPSGSVRDGTLRFPVNGLPQPPTIALLQDGNLRCGQVDAEQDLLVRWSRFAEGSADENGILDDLVFAILEDSTGKRIAHSGRPFEGRPFLTFKDTEYVIAADTMQQGRRYTLSVEHAVLTDTRRFDAVPAMTTYAVTTLREIETGAGRNCEPGEGIKMAPTTDAQVIMFYYADLGAADRFYGQTLGLEKTLDYDWVKFYKTSETSSVGLVADSEGAWHKPQARNAVMLSMVTSEVDAWYEALRDKPGVKVLKELGDGGGIRSFLVEDPGGYTVEFFQWL